MVLDQVRKSPGYHTYEQRWHAAGPLTGSGSVADPAVVSSGGATLRGVWLEPPQVNVVQGGQQSNAGITFHDNRVLVPGTSDTTILNLWYSGSLQGAAPLPGATANTRGATLTWSADRVDKIMAPIQAGVAADAEHTLDGCFAWLRRDAAGQTIAYAVGESVSLVQSGAALLTSDEPISAVIQGSEIWATRSVGADPAVLPHVTLRVPGAVSRVVLDGADVPFVQSGDTVSIGAPPPPPPPASPPATKDRFYSFTDGQALDAVLSGPAEMLNGFLMAAGGEVTLQPCGGDAYPAKPLWISLELGLSRGYLGRLSFESVGLTPQIASLDLIGTPTADILVTSQTLLAPPMNVTVPRAPSMHTRVSVVFRPTLGTVDILDRFGAVVGSGVCGVLSQDFKVTLSLEDGTVIDNLGVYDSAENGVDPMGVAVWLLPDGRIGFAVQSPVVIGTSAAMTVGGSAVPGWMASLWFNVNGLKELLVLDHAPPPWTTLPAGWRELAFETVVPGAVPVVPGVIYGVSGHTAAGIVVQAGAWFQ